LENPIWSFLFCSKPFSNKTTGNWNMKKRSRENRPILVPNPKGKLFDQVREVLRFHHYSIRTEKTYCQWIRRYLAFHRSRDRSGPQRGWRHPSDLGAAEVVAFLSDLAVTRDVAASTQNQALHPVR
jgi:hypothetical protein